MDAATLIESTLGTVMLRAEAGDAPPRLAAAMRHAVFPRGARVRPRLCLAVASACGADDLTAAAAAGAALELLHCASLVHDDLPCFDNAPIRRGKPSVHAAFGAPLAVLAGDALIVLAFQTVAFANPLHLAGLIGIVAQSVGMPGGIVAGQAWESEDRVDLARYQRAKTSALFAAAAMAGALSAGHDASRWRALGEHLGDAYQIADDLCDAAGDASMCGKPIGQDSALHRPSAVQLYGIDGALDRLDMIAERAAASIPDCLGAAALRALIVQEAKRLVPKTLVRAADARVAA